jgi:hypothetical protein
MPVVLVALLLVVQVGVVVRDAMALIQAAREGARVAAITGDDVQATATVRSSAGPIDGDRIQVTIEPPSGERARAEPVTVRLVYADKLTIPIVSRLVSFDLPLHADATMSLELTPTPSPSPAP